MTWAACAVAAILAAAPARAVTQMDVYRVLEDPIGVLGFDRRFELKGLGITRQIKTVTIYRVLPNTAASRAGLRPGDLIVATDGIPVASLSKGQFDSIRKRKEQIGQSGLPVTWDLRVLSEGDRQPHSARLQLPFPAPWWGSSVYAAPVGRGSATVSEPGPLADRARTVLDLGYWTLLPPSVAKAFALARADRSFLCYGWTIEAEGQSHEILVSQERGKTDIIFATYSKGLGAQVRYLLTAPPAR